MPECVCGATVSHLFVRVLGPNPGHEPEVADVYACRECSDRTEVEAGAPAGHVHRVLSDGGVVDGD